uniref:SAM domain-containing protein n=2 Tax=Graphocephala atropunctata TaxID=36148 RepID=A0A1B6MB21_9HEMI
MSSNIIYCRPAGMSDDEHSEDEFEFSDSNDYFYKNKKVCFDELPESKESLFYSALKYEKIDTMKSMLANGFHVDQPLSGGWSPLMHACSFCFVPAIEFLIKAQANVNFNKELFTPMMALCNSSSTNEEELLKCLDLLLKHGANVNATDRHASTALMYASSCGHLELVRRLLENKCDVNIQDTEGWSALFHAVVGGHEDVVQLLLQGKARLDLIDRRRRTAFQLALEKGYEDIAKLVCSKTEKRRLLEEENSTLPDKKIIKDPVEELIGQLPGPNAKSVSGFSSDVNKLLLAMQLGHIGKQFSAKNIQLNEFLLTTDERLKELGVRFSVHRQRILNSIRKFHLHQWNKASLGMKPQNQQMDVEDGIRLMCNVTKHLHILNATVNYIRVHQPIPIQPEVFKMCENVLHQLDLINGELKVIHSFASNLDHKEKLEPVDLIKPKKESRRYFLTVLASSVFIGFIFWRKSVSISIPNLLHFGVK